VRYGFFIHPLLRLILLFAIVQAASGAWIAVEPGTFLILALIALYIARGWLRMAGAYLRTWGG
jgi:hypothetical protein